MIKLTDEQQSANAAFLLRQPGAWEMVKAACPDFVGKILRPKADGPHAGKIPMSLSMTLIDVAGDLHSLIKHWEVDPT